MKTLHQFREEVWKLVSRGERAFFTFGEMAERLRDVADDIDPEVAKRHPKE